MQVDYQLLDTLLELETAPSFAAAAVKLRVSTSAVSQRLQLLEHQLGFTLFERIGRRNRMTSAAKELCGVVRDSLQPLDETIARLRGDHTETRGVVRIGGPLIFSRMWLRPRLAELKRRFPQLLPEVQYDMAWVLSPRLAAGELDLCIIVGPVDEHLGLASRLIYTEEFVCVAAPSYVAAHGAPRTVEDFSSRAWVVYDTSLVMLSPWWHAKFGRRVPPPRHHAARVGSLDEMLALVESGVGLCVLPTFFVEESLEEKHSQLVEPPHPRGKPIRRALYPIHLAWRRAATETARVRAVRDLLLE